MFDIVKNWCTNNPLGIIFTSSTSIFLIISLIITTKEKEKLSKNVIRIIIGIIILIIFIPIFNIILKNFGFIFYFLTGIFLGGFIFRMLFEGYAELASFFILNLLDIFGFKTKIKSDVKNKVELIKKGESVVDEKKQ